MRPLLIVTAILCLSGRPLAAPPEAVQARAAQQSAMPLETYRYGPSLSTELRFDADRSPLGWGSFDLSALPEQDEIRVDLLICMPSSTAAWRQCDRMLRMADDQVRQREAEWAGVPMRDGVYDAVRVRLTIEDVRLLVSATKAASEICGEQMPLPADTREALSQFVRRFDEIAGGNAPSAPTPRFELSREHDFFPEPAFVLPVPA